MGRTVRAIELAGKVSTVEWLLRLVPPALGLMTWVWGAVEGWPSALIVIAGLVVFAASLGILTAGHYWWEILKAKRYPEHHKVVLRELAEALAELKASSLTVGAWERMSPTPHQVEHSERHRNLLMRVGQLIDQISYDKETAATCKDFAQLCSFIVYDAIHKDDYRESRQELDRLSEGLFRYLHSGKSVDRRKIELPHWIKENDKEAELRGQERDRSSVRRIA